MTVWDALRPGGAASAVVGVQLPPETRRAISESERAAIRKAREGAELAREAGLAPEFDARQGSGVGGIAEALIDAAETWDADLIVVGCRDTSRL